MGKKYVKAVYCHPAYLSYLQSTSYEMPEYMNRELPDVHARFIEKAEETSNCQHPLENRKKKWGEGIKATKSWLYEKFNKIYKV